MKMYQDCVINYPVSLYLTEDRPKAIGYRMVYKKIHTLILSSYFAFERITFHTNYALCCFLVW